MRRPPIHLLRHGILLGISALAIAVPLAGCGAAGDGTSAADPSVDSGDAPTDRNEAFVLYDGCMADHGFPTNSSGQESSDGLSVRSGSAGGDAGPQMAGPGGIEIDPAEQEAFTAANQECQGHLANVVGGEELDPEKQAVMEDASLKVEQCMRDKGFDVQLGSGSGGDGGLSVNESGDDPSAAGREVDDADRAAADAAMEECSKIFDDYPELEGGAPVPGAAR
jgi:hypothetical protein